MTTRDLYLDIYASLYGGPYPMAILSLRVELLLSGIWTDISTPGYVLQNRSGPGCTITRGHPDEGPQTQPSQNTAYLKNKDGRFSDKNPAGAYYGSIGRNTQMRVSVPEGATYLRSESDQASYASCPDSAGISITGDTELQLDVTLDNWSSGQSLAGKWVTTGNQRSWVLELVEDGTLRFVWSTDGTSGGSVTALSTASVPVPALGRQAIKVTLATASGTVKFYTAPAAADQVVSGPITSGWVQLGATVVAGAAAVFDSTAVLTAGCVPSGMAPFGYAGIYGKVHSLKLLSGIGGTVKASPDFTAQTPGAGSFADAQGNTWTLQGTAEISDRRYRFHGEVASWPQAWDPTGTDVYVAVQAAGPLRRLGGSTRPLKSAMRRYWELLAAPPAYYWPCEDQSGGSALASGLAGGGSMTVSGRPKLASDTSFACSSALPVLNSSEWSGSMRSGGVVTVTLLVAVPSAGDTDITTVASVYYSSTAARADINYQNTSSGIFMVSVYDSAGASVAAPVQIVAGVNGTPGALQVTVSDSGGNGTISASFLQPAGSVQTATIAGIVGWTFGTVRRVVINGAITNAAGASGGQLANTVAGHVAGQSAAPSLSALASPLDAWALETAGNRFSRLCSEQGLAFRGQGNLDTTVAMGYQTQLSLTGLLQECADADRGVMFEPRQQFALGYRTRGSLENQAAAAALNYASAQLAGSLQPVEDDQTTTNDVTVSRSGGSSYRAVQSSGTLSVQAPPNGVGTYDTQVTLNLGSDWQNRQAAGWLLHMGTVDEPRYPFLSVDLSRTEVAAMFYDLQDADLGDRVTVASTPVWLPPDGITQLIQGATENLGGYIFTIDWNTVPESPYQTGVLGSAFRLDTDGSTLHSSATSVATSLSVDSAGALWTTTDVPFDIRVAGERMTVTAVSGSTSPQTFTVTRSVNGVVKAQASGAAVALFAPSYVTLS